MSASAGDPRTCALATLGAAATRVAHELRNLLAGIDLAAAMLADQCADDPDLARLSAQLLLGVKRLGAVASNVLTVGRPLALEAGPLDVTRLVAETLAAAAPAIRGASVRVRHRAPAHKVWVLGDADRLRQALLNLTINAVQAMPDGGVLSVRTRVVVDLVEIAVSDTGIGMDRATRARAFEPFFTTRVKGTGLGLAVVREIAEAHGAGVSLSSRPGRGTIVRLRLPLAAQELLA